MEILGWIDRRLPEIKDSVLYGKYFDTIILEEDIDEYSLFNPQLGLDLIVRLDFSIRAIHFYSGNQEGANKFMDKLPFDLDFSFTREQTRKMFGIPNESGGGGDSSVLYGTIPFWDKYRYDSFYLHLQFLPNNAGIDLVTVFSLNN
jgi:hypothetical protein